MAAPQSSVVFDGLEDELHRQVKLAYEMNNKMRVPKRIKATGEFSDEDLLLYNQNAMINSWNYHDKIDMNVSDRIVVLGHNQHLETRSAPREIQLENSILNKNPSAFVRVPPRTITLNDHYFPSAFDESSSNKSQNGEYLEDGDCEDDIERPPPYVTNNEISNKAGEFPTNYTNSVESDSQLTTNGAAKRLQTSMNNQSDISMMIQPDGTPMGNLTTHEEILYLRHQFAKLNRRVLNIEIVNEQRLQREKIVYCLGLAYFVLKAIVWLNRN